MWRELRTAAVLLVVLTILVGIAYPAVVTALAQAIFPHQANGSLVLRGEQPVGSELIGQPFSDPGYFWGRLSATVGVPYDASRGAGSNLAPSNPGLVEAARARLGVLHSAGSTPEAKAPVDLVTASGSGLDPDISIASALYQVPRVASARGLDESVVRDLVARHTVCRQLGFLGEPRVNVLSLNLALDELQ